MKCDDDNKDLDHQNEMCDIHINTPEDLNPENTTNDTIAAVDSNNAISTVIQEGIVKNDNRKKAKEVKKANSQLTSGVLMEKLLYG